MGCGVKINRAVFDHRFKRGTIFQPAIGCLDFWDILKLDIPKIMQEQRPRVFDSSVHRSDLDWFLGRQCQTLLFSSNLGGGSFSSDLRLLFAFFVKPIQIKTGETSLKGSGALATAEKKGPKAKKMDHQSHT